MTDYSDFWVAVAAAAPVIALGAIVLVPPLLVRAPSGWVKTAYGLAVLAVIADFAALVDALAELGGLSAVWKSPLGNICLGAGSFLSLFFATIATAFGDAAG